MTSFHKLIISDIQRLTSDAVAISFVIPDDLQTKFQFQHGQFIQLRAQVNDEEVERAYSICTAPYERKITVGIKCVEQGVFSNFANKELSVGDEIEVSEPQGVFTHELDSSKSKNYLLVAAGSGITPILSILKMTLASETMSKCILIYANKNPESTMFKGELDALIERYSDRIKLITVFSNSGSGDFKGRVNPDLLASCIEDIKSIDDFFVCGPQGMSVELREWMIEGGMAAESTHIELFEASNNFSSDSEQGSNAQISVSIDGDTISFEYADSTRSILDVALDYDGDLPYGCQNGSCGSCQCKLISGSVEMEVNYALSQSEVDDGFVLLCQSRPTSSKVELDYDA